MKNTKYFFLAVIAFVGCTGYSQKNSNVVKIEFTSLTRGFNKQIVITKDSLSMSVSERGSETQNQKRKLNSKEWEGLLKSIEGVSIKEVPDMKSPTEKRAFDGAKHSTITITPANGQPVSHSFDDEEPNEKLQKLMDQINKLLKSVK